MQKTKIYKSYTYDYSDLSAEHYPIKIFEVAKQISHHKQTLLACELTNLENISMTTKIKMCVK